MLKRIIVAASACALASITPALAQTQGGQEPTVVPETAAPTAKSHQPKKAVHKKKPAKAKAESPETEKNTDAK